MFIAGFANHTKPLTNLRCKDIEWSWVDKEEQAFTKLKMFIKNKLILAHPELSEPFRLKVDASGYAIGAGSVQQKADRKWPPIAYFPAALNTAKRNYNIYDLELLMIVRSLDQPTSFKGSTDALRI